MQDAPLDSELVPASGLEATHLMIVLHGLGDSLEGYRWLPRMLALPWLEYRLVNAPDPYYGGGSWYDFAGNPGPGVRRSRQLLFDLLDRERARGVPTERTFLFGFSQGALMTVEVGLRYPHRLAGLIGISGYVFEPEVLVKERSTVAKEQRFLLTHGTQDSLIPFSLVRSQVTGLKAAGLNVEWHEFAKEHTIAGEEELGVIRGFLNRQRGEPH